MEKLPPISKVHEAWSAIADGRVTSDDFAAAAGCAQVASSDGAKSYTVSWSADDTGATAYSSNDNATYWRGYAGYPVIAVLMMQGRLPLDRGVADEFARVNWTELNERFKRDYPAAVAHIVAARDLDAARVQEAAQTAYDALRELGIAVKRGAVKPPSSKRA